MFSKIHDKLGTAGFVAAVIALIVALSGAAFAAGGLTKSQEKQVKKIISKEIKKHPGPQGPKGDPGPQGQKGDAGSAGVSGKDGTSITSKALAAGDSNCPEGGSEFKGASGVTFACNGAVGPTETKLPSGQTLKGLWQFQVNQNPFGLGVMTVSFPLRVEPAPSFEWVATGTTAGENEHCPGTADAPQAEPGYFCLYGGLVLGTTSEEPGTLGADPTLGFRGEWGIEGEVALAYGSWAVTAD